MRLPRKVEIIRRYGLRSDWILPGLIILAIIAYGFCLAVPLNLSAAYFPLDGRFQTFNAVDRIFGGEIPGRDFQPYLGIGVTWMSAIATWPFGKDFLASIWGDNFIHILLFFGNAVLILWLLPMRWPWRIYGLSVLLPMIAGTMALSDSASALAERLKPYLVLIFPANSDYGIRAALPMLMGFVMLTLHRVVHPSWYYWISLGVMGLIAGGAPFWSNDFGLATAVSLVVLSPWLSGAAFRGIRRTIPFLITAIGAVVSFFAIGQIMTGGRLQSWIDYNFEGVAREQGWYFIHPEGEDIGNRLSAIGVENFAALLIMGGTLLFLARRKCQDDVRLALFGFLTLAAISGGLVPFLLSGGDRRYLGLITLLGALTALGLVARSIGRALTGTKIAWVLKFILLGLSLHFAVDQVRSRWLELAGNAAPLASLYVAEMGGNIPLRLEDEVRIGREIRQKTENLPPAQRVVSPFATMIDKIAGARNPTGFDYLIHARGPSARKAYLEHLTIDRPHYAVTVRQDYTLFGWWAWRRDWWFFRKILTDYDVYYVSRHHVIWQRRDQPRRMDDKRLDCRVTPNDERGASLSITDPGNVIGAGPAIADVAVDYQTRADRDILDWLGLKPYQALIAENTTSQQFFYGVPGHRTGPLALNPLANSVDVPVQMDPGQPAIVELFLSSRVHGTLNVTGCKANVIATMEDISEKRVVTIEGIDGESTQQGRISIKVAPGDLQNVLRGTEAALGDNVRRRVIGVRKDEVQLSGPELSPGFRPAQITFFLR